VLHLPTGWRWAPGWHRLWATATGPRTPATTWPPSPAGRDRRTPKWKSGHRPAPPVTSNTHHEQPTPPITTHRMSVGGSGWTVDLLGGPDDRPVV